MKRYLAQTGDAAHNRDELIAEVRTLNARFRVRTRLLIAVVITALAVVVVAGYWIISNRNAIERANESGAETRALVQCQDRYEKAVRARTIALTAANKMRNDASDRLTEALNDLIRASINEDRNRIPHLTSIWLRAAHSYDVAKKQYRATQKAHPVPPPPKYLCAGKAARAQPRTPTKTETKTVTKTAPAPPAKTITVPVPGPVRTKTVTRCVRPNGRPC